MKKKLVFAFKWGKAAIEQFKLYQFDEMLSPSTVCASVVGGRWTKRKKNMNIFNWIYFFGYWIETNGKSEDVQRSYDIRSMFIIRNS